MTYRILITEDDRVQREIISDILEHSGYAVRASASGGESLEALNDATFDVLLTDLKMPGMDGL